MVSDPRLHLRYEPVKGTSIRISAGRGQRTANIFAENNSVLVSARAIVMPALNTNAYGLNPEVAWNKGISVDQQFRLFNRSASLNVDFSEMILVTRWWWTWRKRVKYHSIISPDILIPTACRLNCILFRYETWNGGWLTGTLMYIAPIVVWLCKGRLLPGTGHLPIWLMS